jgi:hypothetical protein
VLEDFGALRVLLHAPTQTAARWPIDISKMGRIVVLPIVRLG